VDLGNKSGAKIHYNHLQQVSNHPRYLPTMPAISSAIDFNSITHSFQELSLPAKVGGTIGGLIAVYLLHAVYLDV